MSDVYAIIPELQTGWRSAEVLQGDTLQELCNRELGDPARWAEIAWINGLIPPYLTGDKNDPRLAQGKLVLYGGRLRVPQNGTLRSGTTPVQAFGRDISLSDHGFLSADGNGDLSLVEGVPCLEQGLAMRLNNERGALLFHPKYGNEAHRLMGKKLSPTLALVAMRFCEETVAADPRVRAVSNSSYTVAGDALKVSLTADVDGHNPLRVQVVL